MKITIYDGNNWFRRRIETDMEGKAVSSCFFEVQNSPSFPIVVWDGFNSRKKRKEIYPEYKASRKAAGESIYDSQDMLAKLLEFGKGLSIRIPEFEADDVIAYLARRYGDAGHEIFIESNDGDLAQLGFPLATSKNHGPPQWIALNKTLVGDSSDNIPGAKGFGKGTWEKLSEQDMQTLSAIVVSYINETEERVLEQLDTVQPLSKTVKNWMVKKDNRQLLLDFYKIINFIPVPEDLIEEHTKVGLKRPELATPILKEYML